MGRRVLHRWQCLRPWRTELQWQFEGPENIQSNEKLQFLVTDGRPVRSILVEYQRSVPLLGVLPDSPWRECRKCNELQFHPHEWLVLIVVRLRGGVFQ